MEVPSNGSVSFVDLASGEHTVLLSGLPPFCGINFLSPSPAPNPAEIIVSVTRSRRCSLECSVSAKLEDSPVDFVGAWLKLDLWQLDLGRQSTGQPLELGIQLILGLSHLLFLPG